MLYNDSMNTDEQFIAFAISLFIFLLALPWLINLPTYPLGDQSVEHEKDLYKLLGAGFLWLAGSLFSTIALTLEKEGLTVSTFIGTIFIFLFMFPLIRGLATKVVFTLSIGACGIFVGIVFLKVQL